MGGFGGGSAFASGGDAFGGGGKGGSGGAADEEGEGEDELGSTRGQGGTLALRLTPAHTPTSTRASSPSYATLDANLHTPTLLPRCA